MHSQPFSPAGYVPPPPRMEVDLAPGDLLYLPRGYVHSASTSGEHSVHVTIGVTVFTWVELLNEALQACKAIPAFREALPAGFAGRPELRRELAEGLGHRLAALHADSEREGLVDAFLQRVRASRPRRGRRFASDTVVVGWNTELAPPPSTQYAVGSDRGNTTLDFDGRRLLLPAGVRAMLDAIAVRPRFRPAELPPHLDEQATLAFVRFLEGEGFLRRLG